MLPLKYKSSLTNGIKVVIIVFILFWVATIGAIITTASITDAVISSLLLLLVASTYVLALVKGIYIVIEDNYLKYVHMFLFKRGVEISKIKKIQKSLYWGQPSLSLISEENGKMTALMITTFTFKRDTLNQFLSYLKTQNPSIEVDQSAHNVN